MDTDKKYVKQHLDIIEDGIKKKIKYYEEALTYINFNKEQERFIDGCIAGLKHALYYISDVK